MAIISLAKLSEDSCVLTIDGNPQVITFEEVGTMFVVEAIPKEGAKRRARFIVIARLEHGIVTAEGFTPDEATRRLGTHGQVLE